MTRARLAVAGALGRMGRRVAALAGSFGFTLAGALEREDHPQLGRELAELVPGAASLPGARLTGDLDEALAQAQVLVDFALAEGASERIARAAARGCALVSGVTGLDAQAEAQLRRAAQSVPVVWAPNMSFGVQVLRRLVALAAGLWPDSDVEIHELHHGLKRDAPSGTALALAGDVVAARGGGEVESSRSGQRAPSSVGVSSSRGGDAVGEHTVYLLAEGERLELIHRATSRDIFARGALRAARALLDRPPGRYELADIWFDREATERAS